MASRSTPWRLKKKPTPSPTEVPTPPPAPGEVQFVAEVKESVCFITVKCDDKEDVYSLKAAREGSTYTVLLSTLVGSGEETRFKGIHNVRQLVANIGDQDSEVL